MIVLFDGTANRPWGKSLLPDRVGQSTLDPRHWIAQGPLASDRDVKMTDEGRILSRKKSRERRGK